MKRLGIARLSYKAQAYKRYLKSYTPVEDPGKYAPMVKGLSIIYKFGIFWIIAMVIWFIISVSVC